MGLSIISIILYHVYLFTDKYYGIELTPLKILFSKGYIGVDVFLFLSAYGLCHSLNGGGITRFYLRRFQRIIPTYICYLAILFSIFCPQNLIEIFESSVLQVTGLSSIRILNKSLEWYIPALMLLYLSFPFLYKFVKYVVCKYGFKVEQIIFAALCMATYGLNAIFVTEFAYRIPIMILGILTYIHLQQNEKERLNMLYVSSAAMGLYFSCNLLSYSLIMPLVLLCLNKISVQFPMNSFLQLCGKHSLELYLSQSLMLKHLMQAGMIDSLPLTLTIGFIGIPIIAMLLYLLQNGFNRVIIRK